MEEKCPKSKSFKEWWIEAVKCHHHNMANYLQNNYSSEICFNFFRFYNFSVLSYNDINNETMFYYSCKYNYYYLCKTMLNSTMLNINCLKSTWINYEKPLK